MVNASAPLDLYDLLVNELVGSLDLFMVAGILIIFLVCRKGGMSHYAAILFSMIFLSIVVAIVYKPLWWALTLLLTGLIFYMSLSKRLRG